MVIITDPVFGSLPFLKRLSELPLLSHNIPHVDYVLISHNHWDHLCLKTIDKLYKINNKLKICAPHGDARHFRKYQNCIEHNWWESSIFERLKITFLPTNHWSQTNLLDRNKSLWGSWLIEAGKKIYFGGDSSYDTHYEEIGNYYPDIDYALLPIGPCEPRKMMSKSHMGPEESLKAFQDLKAKFLVPMHWGTFSFGLDDRHTALERLKNSAHQNLEKIKILSVGQNIIL